MMIGNLLSRLQDQIVILKVRSNETERQQSCDNDAQISRKSGSQDFSDTESEQKNTQTHDDFEPPWESQGLAPVLSPSAVSTRYHGGA